MALDKFKDAEERFRMRSPDNTGKNRCGLRKKHGGAVMTAQSGYCGEKLPSAENTVARFWLRSPDADGESRISAKKHGGEGPVV